MLVELRGLMEKNAFNQNIKSYSTYFVCIYRSTIYKKIEIQFNTLKVNAVIAISAN